MKRSLPPSKPVPTAIEPLEARIAPAVLLIGKPNDTADAEYSDAPTGSFLGFVKMFGATDQISNAVGTTSVNTYYLKLHAGDSVNLYNAQQTVKGYISVASGSAVAFFQDTNGNNEFDQGELMGFSVSMNAALTFKDAVPGDIVQNLSLDGNTLFKTRLVDAGPVNNLDFRSGDVAGNVLIGRSLLQGAFNGVNNIYAGTATSGLTYDFFPTLPIGGATIDPFVTAPGKVGGSITNVTIDRIGNVNKGNPVGVIQAGDGGLGALGGSIRNIQISRDVDGFTLQAGKGGDADATKGLLIGGQGGGLSQIFIAGVSEAATGSENNPIRLIAGAGGNAPDLTGGAGGAASQIYVGFRSVSGIPQKSSDFLHDNVALFAGDGGDGRIAGAGGGVSSVRFTVSTTGDALLNEPELLVHAGDGGDISLVSKTGIKAGNGGRVADVIIRNQASQDLLDPSAPAGSGILLPNAAIRVEAGDGGNAGDPLLTKAAGGTGGTVSVVSLLGSNLSVAAGVGSAGTTGGAGGNLTLVTVLQEGNFYARSADFTAGAGGDSTVGVGGAGGNITNLIVRNADFGDIVTNNPGTVFSATAGKGGNAAKNFGGLGGSINGFQLFDDDSRADNTTASRLTGTALITTGRGGDGLLGGVRGGNFGDLQPNVIATHGLNVTVAVGNGGDGVSTGSGNGGRGGLISRLNLDASGNIVADPFDPNSDVELPVNAVVAAGNGGSGGTAMNSKAAGGAGGAVILSAVNTAGGASLSSGTGGNGAGGAAGAGGNVTISASFGRNGSASLTAGNAGLNGALPGVGGSIVGLDLDNLSGAFGTDDVTIKAGNGSHGGAGGSLRFVGYGAGSQTLLPTPFGDIRITAGDGSVEGNFVGAGGSIVRLTGSVSSGFDTETVIKAGDGGGSATRSAAGGSISFLLLKDGPTDFLDSHTGELIPRGTLTIQAGDAGNAKVTPLGLSVLVGAAGGSVSDVTMQNLGQSTLIRSIAAGDGAPGTLTGGLGGSVSRVDASGHTIGQKTGAVYGFAPSAANPNQPVMGGIFAGLGGTGTTDGKAGSVLGIRADSISAIVAGRGDSPGLVERVERITLSTGPTLPPALATSQDSRFQLTYHPVMEQTVLAGTANDPGSIQFTRLLGGTDTTDYPNNPKRPGGGATTFTITYDVNRNGDTADDLRTVQIDANATASDIQTALNFIVPNGVTVTEDKVNKTFTVDFNNAGDRAPLIGIGIEKTGSLPGNSTASDVRQALNGLPNVDDSIFGNGKFDGVDVVTTNSADYQVTFRNIGDAGNITGERILPGVTKVTTEGSIFQPEVQNVDVLGVGDFTLTYGNDNIGFSTTPRFAPGTPANVVQAALNALPQLSTNQVTVKDGVNGSYDIQFANVGTAPGLVKATEFSVVTLATSQGGSVQSVEINKGGATAEQQLVTVPTTGSYRFRLGNSNPTVLLPQGSNAAAVDAALESIPAIGVGGVTVAGNAADGFTVTFQPGTDFDPIVLETTEKQTVNFPLLRSLDTQGLQFSVIDTLDATKNATITLPANASAQDLQNALNALPAINDNVANASRNGVTVTLTADNTYTVKFNTAEDDTFLDITGQEFLPTRVTELVKGQVTGNSQISQDLNGTGDNPEIQSYTAPTSGFYTLTFNGQQYTFPAGTSDSDVTTALNAPNSTFEQVGGANVQDFGGTYQITFNTNGDRDPIQISAQIPEVQRIDISNRGDFVLTVNGNSTGPLDPNISAANLQAQLNSLPGASGFVVTGGAQGVYDITFGTAGDANPIVVAETVDLTPLTSATGTIKLQIPRATHFSVAEFNAAHIVGAIADFNELGSDVFKFIDVNGDGKFNLSINGHTGGDIPIDGLIAAKVFNQTYPTNFAPQARYVLKTINVPGGIAVPVAAGQEFFDLKN